MKFAKIAVNVMTRGGVERNVLPDPMRNWFGANAELPGATPAVAFERVGSEGTAYVLWPVQDRGVAGPEFR